VSERDGIARFRWVLGFRFLYFLLRVFSLSLYIIIFMYSLGFAKIGIFVAGNPTPTEVPEP